MEHLPKPELQHLLLDRMKHNKAKTFSMRTLKIFYHYIMNEQERSKLHRVNNKTFEKYIHEFRAVPESWISMRHDKDGGEVFYLTVKTCPMDKNKINRILCNALRLEGRCN